MSEVCEKFLVWIDNVDVACFYLINHSLQTLLLDRCLPWLSNAGEAGLIWVLTGLALYVTGRPALRQAALLMLAAVLFSYLTGECIKHLLQRPRPFETIADAALLVRPVYTYSFPSEHAANAFAAALVLWRKLRGLTWLLFLLAPAMALSRVYVGVHYPLDILAGSLMGLACAALVLKYENRLFFRRKSWRQENWRQF